MSAKKRDAWVIAALLTAALCVAASGAAGELATLFAASAH